MWLYYSVAEVRDNVTIVQIPEAKSGQEFGTVMWFPIGSLQDMQII